MRFWNGGRKIDKIISMLKQIFLIMPPESFVLTRNIKVGGNVAIPFPSWKRKPAFNKPEKY